MKAVIQRVLNASVTVDGEMISSIGKGLCVLIGISRDDTDREIDYIVRKILNLRVFDDEDGKRWNKSVIDLQLPVLCVSQFTLYAVLKGNKPDFHQTMANDQSRDFYQRFLSRMSDSHKPEFIKDGLFGAFMQVHIQNDGPVTISVDSADMGDDGRVKKDKFDAWSKKKEKNVNCSKEVVNKKSSGAQSEESLTQNDRQLSDSLEKQSIEDKDKPVV